MRRDPVTGQWRYVTSKEMLQAEKDMAKVQRAMQSWDEQMRERARRQAQELMQELMSKLRQDRD